MIAKSDFIEYHKSDLQLDLQCVNNRFQPQEVDYEQQVAGKMLRLRARPRVSLIFAWHNASSREPFPSMTFISLTVSGMAVPQVQMRTNFLTSMNTDFLKMFSTFGLLVFYH